MDEILFGALLGAVFIYVVSGDVAGAIYSGVAIFLICLGVSALKNHVTKDDGLYDDDAPFDDQDDVE